MGNGNDRGDVMPHRDICWNLWDGAFFKWLREAEIKQKQDLAFISVVGGRCSLLRTRRRPTSK